MKKLIALLLVISLMLPAAALAETLYYAQDDAELADAAAAAFSLEKKETPERIKALDALLSDPSGLALVTEQQFIEGLQGYGEADRDTVETGFVLVSVLGQSDLYLVCSAETAEAAGISDLASVRTYLEENEYALIMMRSLSADQADYAATQLMDALYFDSETFVDAGDEADNLEGGEAYVMVCDTARALEMADAGCVVLGPLTQKRTAEFPDLPSAGECGLPVIGGSWFALCGRADGAAWEGEAQLPEDALAAYCLHAPEAPVSLPQIIEDYVDYMTAEGLFFY